VPPLFEAEAGRAGFSLEQPTALLGAAGRPPERLRDGHLAGMPSGSSPEVFPISSAQEGRRVSDPALAHVLPKAFPPASPVNPALLLKAELDATSPLAALVQQNNNLLGALTT